MNEKLVRIKSVDGIEMPGILYTPKDYTEGICIHVHGMNGNFYENRFVDVLADTYTENGYSFLTFNNKGRDFITELIKDDDFTLIGGSLERFQDSLFDIQGAIDYVKKLGYKNIILEGHSYGCNKVLYYYNKIEDNSIKKIVLLAPCDIPEESKKFLSSDEYENAVRESKELVQKGRDMELINYSVMANGKVAAGTFYYDFLPDGENDFIRYRDGIVGNSDVLSCIKIPVLVIFGDKDECVLTESIDVVTGYLKNNISNCNIQIINNTDYIFTDKFNELGEIIKCYLF